MFPIYILRWTNGLVTLNSLKWLQNLSLCCWSNTMTSMANVFTIMTHRPWSESLIKIHIQQEMDILSHMLDGRVLIYEVLLNVSLYCTGWDVECEGRKEQQGWPGNSGKKINSVNSDKNHQTNTKYRKHITIAMSDSSGVLASPGSQKHTHHSMTLKNTGYCNKNMYSSLSSPLMKTPYL